MKNIFVNIFVLILVCLSSCRTLDYKGEGEELVVEGWINNDGFPVVFVSRTIPAQEEAMNITELRKYIEYQAKVKISDGEQEISLVGRNDDRYVPSYQYTTSEMRGETGKTYTISVVTEDGLTASCTSTINKSVPLTDVRPVKTGTGDYYLEASFINSISDNLYYRFYVLVEGKNEVWIPSILGTVDGSLQDGPVTATVNNGTTLDGYDVKLSFSAGDRVHIRFCTMDKTMFEYWTIFENLQTITMNPIVPSKDNLPPVVDGAKGYWTGYGVFETYIEIPKD